MNKKTVSALILTLLLTGTLTMAFNVQPAKSDYVWSETIYIQADGSVQPPAAPITTVDNVTYTITDDITGNIQYPYSAIIIQRDNITIDGAGYTLQGARTFGSTGIELTGRSNVTVKSVKITAFWEGVWLDSSFGISVSGNTVANNWDGIMLVSSSNISVSGNNITANNGYGVYLSSSSDSSIVGNTVANNGDVINGAGIELGSSSNNSVSGNTVANNEFGIWLDISSNSSVIGNNITNNNYGIMLRYSNTAIYHNSFVNNTKQVDSTGSVSIWDDGYPSGGNSWSDYNGTDANADGIGDAPYEINANNTDNYPLMIPFGSILGDVDGDGSVGRDDILLVASHFGRKTGEPDYSRIYDLNGDGYIGVDDIFTVARHFSEQENQ